MFNMLCTSQSQPTWHKGSDLIMAASLTSIHSAPYTVVGWFVQNVFLDIFFYEN